MARIAKRRYISIGLDVGDIIAWSEHEYYAHLSGNAVYFDEAVLLATGHNPCDYVWQWALNHDDAISNHEAKLDEWEENPNKRTY